MRYSDSARKNLQNSQFSALGKKSVALCNIFSAFQRYQICTEQMTNIFCTVYNCTDILTGWKKVLKSTYYILFCVFIQSFQTHVDHTINSPNRAAIAEGNRRAVLVVNLHQRCAYHALGLACAAGARITFLPVI